MEVRDGVDGVAVVAPVKEGCLARLAWGSEVQVVGKGSSDGWADRNRQIYSGKAAAAL